MTHKLNRSISPMVTKVVIVNITTNYIEKKSTTTKRTPTTKKKQTVKSTTHTGPVSTINSCTLPDSKNGTIGGKRFCFVSGIIFLFSDFYSCEPIDKEYFRKILSETNIFPILYSLYNIGYS